MALLEWQKEVAKSKARFKVIAGGRRLGKSVFSSRILRAKSVQKDNSLYAYIAPTFQQGKDIMWANLTKSCNDFIVKKNEQDLRITLINGSEIRIYSWDAIDRLLGLAFDGIILDEVAIYRNFRYGWENVVRPTLMDKSGWCMFISMPRGFNHFEQLHTRGLKLNDWQSFTFSTHHNPLIPKKELEDAKMQMSDTAYKQEILGLFVKNEGLVYDSWSRSLIKPLDFIPEKHIAGIDFGYNHHFAMPIIAVRDGIYHIVDEIYQTKLSIDDRNKLVKEKIDEYNINRIWADSEDPLGISTLREYTGFNIEAVSKPKDSVINGIGVVNSLMKNNRLFVEPSNIGFLDEVERYSWKESRDGITKDEPIKENDDMMDAIRYAIVNDLNVKTVDWSSVVYI